MATLSDHGDNMYSPFPFTVRRDLSQSADGPRQLPLAPPASLSPNHRKEKRKE